MGTGLLLCICLLAVATSACEADKPRVEIDKETGLAIHYITSEPCINTTAYPTCRTWSRDGKRVFIESGRPRPHGTTAAGERQILSIDIETGEARHLATLEVEDTKPYGAAHIRSSSQYHFDCAHDSDIMAYYDMTGHNLYLMNTSTGKSGRILHENEGTIGDPPAISSDGRRVVYYVRYPSIANRFLGGITTVIFSLDVDPVELKAVGEPKVITAYPGRIHPAVKDRMPDGVCVNHCQVNPADPNHVCYAHEFLGMRHDGSLTLSRTWENKDGLDRPVYKPAMDEWQTHEVIGPLGKSLYFVENWGVSAVDFQTRTKRRIYDNQQLKPCHITISPDEKWIAADMFDGSEPDKDNCYRSGILLIEAATGRSQVLCRTLRGASHPRHPHPNFSPDGTKVAFTVADGPVNSCVAWVDVSEVMEELKEGIQQ